MGTIADGASVEETLAWLEKFDVRTAKTSELLTIHAVVGVALTGVVVPTATSEALCRMGSLMRRAGDELDARIPPKAG